MTELELIAAASAGDGHAFAALVRPYRAELHAHCRAHAALRARCRGRAPGGDGPGLAGAARLEGRASLRGWLHRIATNAGFNEVDRRGRRPASSDEEPPDEAHEPDDREALEDALTAAHERLRPASAQRSCCATVSATRPGRALTLLGTTAVSVDGALQRAGSRSAPRAPGARRNRARPRPSACIWRRSSTTTSTASSRCARRRRPWPSGTGPTRSGTSRGRV